MPFPHDETFFMESDRLYDNPPPNTGQIRDGSFLDSLFLLLLLSFGTGVKGESKPGLLNTMVCHSFFQLAVLVTLFLQVRCSPFTFQKRGGCATEDPGADFLHALGRLQSDEADPAISQARKAPIEIETWFHIVSSKSESSQVTDDMINSQVSCFFFIWYLKC